jgi:prepilin-type N-terminal cleavage/methylation domain-containing protein
MIGNVNKYKAFTLAEVLISLVIIGVIAAITMPVLISNYKKQEATSRLKKFYSTMQQVVIKAKSDGNDWGNWADSANTSNDSSGTQAKMFAEKYILPYLSYNKYTQRAKYEKNSIQIFFNDGTYFDVLKGDCIDLIFDINGTKKPNVTGRDIFRFLYCPVSGESVYVVNKITSYKTNSITTRELAKKKCINDSRFCSALLFFDNWEFKSDYPYKI